MLAVTEGTQMSAEKLTDCDSCPLAELHDQRLTALEDWRHRRDLRDEEREKKHDLLMERIVTSQETLARDLKALMRHLAPGLDETTPAIGNPIPAEVPSGG